MCPFSPSFYGTESVDQKWNPSGPNIPKDGLKFCSLISSSVQYQRKSSGYMEANYSHRDVLILQHLLGIPKQ